MLFVLGFVVGLLTGHAHVTGYQLTGAPAVLTYVAWFVYMIVMEATIGASVGKLLLGIRVQSLSVSAGRVGYLDATIRNVLRFVDAIPYVVPYLLGAILIWSSDTNQRLGDRAAETVVMFKDFDE